MPPLLPRFEAFQQRIEDQRKLGRILLETEAAIEVPKTVQRATLAGDPRRLRGIPAVGRGTAGAVSGSVPHRAVLRLDISGDVRASGRATRLPARRGGAARVGVT